MLESWCEFTMCAGDTVFLRSTLGAFAHKTGKLNNEKVVARRRTTCLLVVVVVRVNSLLVATW